MKGRRIGVLTLGVTLVAFGILFLLRVFVPSWDYATVLRFWPVVLILLGGEVLLSALIPRKEGEPFPRVDALSIVLLILTLLLAGGLAAAQLALERVPALLEQARVFW